MERYTLTNDYPYILEKPVFSEISDPLNPDSDGNGYSDLLDKDCSHGIHLKTMPRYVGK